jgi:hypothetical protein
MSCSLYEENGTCTATFVPEQRQRKRQLIGTLISTPFIGEDEYGEKGCFFCFPDLSCRVPGSFRLKFSLTEIDPAPATEARRFPVLAEDNSDIFTVYTPNDFPGMQASTELVKRLKEQGCLIPIKKGNKQPKRATNNDSLENEK